MSEPIGYYIKITNYGEDLRIIEITSYEQLATLRKDGYGVIVTGDNLDIEHL